MSYLPNCLLILIKKAFWHSTQVMKRARWAGISIRSSKINCHTQCNSPTTSQILHKWRMFNYFSDVKLQSTRILIFFFLGFLCLVDELELSTSIKTKNRVHISFRDLTNKFMLSRFFPIPQLYCYWNVWVRVAKSLIANLKWFPMRIKAIFYYFSLISPNKL